ncbi:hypothetical protein MKW94_029501 [Papaver nudicaule]|uniref:Auxin-responsive protein n=1 Tax=Papaver nudicaule TaxID=74823 RepID=A0AA41SG77_PAPNU|nr:hypothetical protein [Papaver nudicaule]
MSRKIDEEQDGLSSNVDIISISSSSEPKERNYMGALSSCSSDNHNSVLSSLSGGKKSNFNYKATELTLWPPGIRCPDPRDQELCLLNSGRSLYEKELFPLLPSSTKTAAVLGNKRGFSDASNNGFSSRTCLKKLVQSTSVKDKLPLTDLKDGSDHTVSECQHNFMAPNYTGNHLSSKAQVVGSSQIRSSRKNSLATTTKNNDEVDGKPGKGPMYVKVSMDGAPLLRKIDLRSYSAYQELSSALREMFIIGQFGSHGAQESEMQSECGVQDLQNGSEYVLTYEDKDGDWMLVGDVPWGMFIESCKRLRILKCTDSIIGLAPRGM